MTIEHRKYFGPFENELEEQLAYVHHALGWLQTSLKHVMRDDENIQQAFIESGAADAILEAVKRMKIFELYWEDVSITSSEICLENVKRVSQNPPRKWNPDEHSFFYMPGSVGERF
ncbi:MAG TPA: hypothetical protein DEB70_11925 [Planctomycetaceae bacterium]|nr:hypothetical protein [Planctomycetaceae bacterium]